MRTLKWMTIFASLALLNQVVQAQGQSGRIDITGAWLVDQQISERIAVTAGGSYTFQPPVKESSFVFVIE